MTVLVALVQPSVQDRYLIAAICAAVEVAVLVACAIHGEANRASGWVQVGWGEPMTAVLCPGCGGPGHVEDGAFIHDDNETVWCYGAEAPDGE